ncbi:CBM35 domain-containing protein [Dactylosporangium sp. McL0621]|uniref:CBM35 domain-containing protein n=1 Tax=Dactylosporangium sp. McL0621 TaxID=3415678 RepID=UPI003CF62814
MRKLLTALPVLAVLAAVVLARPQPAAALENGLARTPPMGFNNWNTTGCTATFNEAFVLGIADKFVSAGLKDAGYTYVNLDDCWALPSRDGNGNLVPDPARFPHGIKYLADYVHGKGLKFGIYSSAGTKTCNTNGFPGGLGHEQQDANLWASWGVDYLKYDNCNNQNVDARTRYSAMRDALAKTGRPIVYSICEWGRTGPPKVWEWGADVGNLWRTTGDISDNWSSMISRVHTNDDLAQFAGPGHWNDPDMLEVGNGGMTDAEYRAHFSLWAEMAAPLLIGSDIRSASSTTLAMLKNTDVIAVDQDALGRQGTIVSASGGLVVYNKVLANGDRAVVLLNENTTTATVSTTVAAIGLAGSPSYRLKDLWSKATRTTTGPIGASVPGHGVVMYRVSRGDADPNRHEAEAAAIGQGVVESNHTGFSGTGFVNGDNVAGSYVEFTFDATAAGTANLSIGYANGTAADRPADISVNGTVLAAGAAFPPTANWDTWAVKALSAPVHAGANTVRITAATAGGNPNLDYLDAVAGSAPVDYQAEDCTVSQGAVESNHAGYTGTGFVNGDNVAGAYVECTATVAVAGQRTVIVRYANGTTSARPMAVSVNGAAPVTVSFPPTANWDTWAPAELTAPFAAGANTVRLTATTANGGPNLDRLSVED